MSGKLWRSTHMNPARLGPSSTFPGSGTYQITFKLGEAAKNREHQPAMRRGRVCPNVGQRTKPGPSFGDSVENIEKIASRTSQAVSAYSGRLGKDRSARQSRLSIASTKQPSPPQMAFSLCRAGRAVPASGGFLCLRSRSISLVGDIVGLTNCQCHDCQRWVRRPAARELPAA
jgi:hypothetical protein